MWVVTRAKMEIHSIYWLLEVVASHTPLCLYDLKCIFIQSETILSEYFLCFTCFSFLNRLN